MPELILHHYGLSPFSEKVRLAFGLKRLAWRSVEIPVMPPRPDTDPLTGGYRRVPVLQIGADVFCDTALILLELERRVPAPPLFPGGTHGQAAAISAAIERAIFIPAAKVVTSQIGDQLPEAFIEDRKRFMKEDFTRAASERDLPVNRQRTGAQLRLIAAMLADGRPFLLGDAASAADLAAFHMAWFLRKNGGEAVEAMVPLARLDGWMARVAAFGHGSPTPMSPDEALGAARAAEPDPAPPVDGDELSGLRAGDRVAIVADNGDPALRGTLAGADADRLVLRHDDPRTGTVHIHLPRLGYSAVPETAA